MAAVIGPTRSALAAPGGVSGSGQTQGAVNARIATKLAGDVGYRAASAHPRPFVRGRIELPQVVEKPLSVGGIDAIAPKEPEIAVAVGPTVSIHAATRDIPGSRHTQCAVYPGIAADDTNGHRSTSAHPCPFIFGAHIGSHQ